MFCVLFFSKQKRAYELRISDWSSDVCSSDLHVMHHEQWMRARDTLQPLAEQRVRLETASYGAGRASLVDIADAYAALADATLTVLDREALVAADGARLTLTYRSEAQ